MEGTLLLLSIFHLCIVLFFWISINIWLLGDCKTGLGHLVAKTEDEYVQLALQLASDVTALSNLRMSLRDLMSKSPVCDGSNFALALESTYRSMWHRYCKGDVPSLRRMEILQQQNSEEPATKLSEPARITNSRDDSSGSIKTNGFPSAMVKLSTSEENGVSWITCWREVELIQNMIQFSWCTLWGIWRKWGHLGPFHRNVYCLWY